MNVTSNGTWSKHLFFWLAASIFGQLALPGCASLSDLSGASAGRSELVTESDESSERKRARIRIELALGYFEQGKTTIALDEIKQAIVADPAFSDAYSLRGLIYMRLNDYATAEESFGKALAINPKDANVLHNLASVSYTHLDVYKRQPLSNLSATKAFATRSPNGSMSVVPVSAARSPLAARR